MFCHWIGVLGLRGAKLGFMTCAHLHYLINFFNIEIQIFGLITPEKIHVCSLPHLLWVILSFSLIYKTWSYLLCFVRHDASIVDRMISISICIIFRVLYSLKTKACIRIQSLLVVTSPCLLLCITVSTTTKKAAPSLLFIWLSCWVCFFVDLGHQRNREKRGVLAPWGSESVQQTQSVFAGRQIYPNTGLALGLQRL